jgi:hypothetical protein
MRKTIESALRLNEGHVASQKAAQLTFTGEEANLLESLRQNPAFAACDKSQLDRHTIKHLLVSVSDQPVSVCEKVANKCERLMIRGVMNESLESTGNLLTEEWDPKGDLPQGDADSLSKENDGEDHEKPAGEKSKANTGKVGQEKAKHGDKSDVAKSEKDGYKNESEDDKDLDEEDDDKDLDEQDDDKDLDEEDDDKDLDEEDDEDEKKKDESDDEEDLDEEHPDNKADRDPQMESDKDDDEELKEEGAEGSQNDAKDPAPEKDRAASSATYVKGCKQNESDDDADDMDEGDDEFKKDMEEARKRYEARKCEADDDDEKKDESDDDDLKEDDLSRDDETKDVKDHPDYDKVKKEDPSNSPLDKGPEDPKLESLDAIESRICDILTESGIKKGSARWNEAYVRGWNLAMNHRAAKLNS